MFGVSQIVGALLMYGIGSGVHTIATWRVLFMVCGGCTIAAGILFIFGMPGDTKSAWFLNERERHVATQRLALDRATRDRAHFDMAQAREALRDPRTALYALMALFITLPTPIVKASRPSQHIPRPLRVSFDGMLTGCNDSSRLWSSTDSATASSRPCWSVCPAELLPSF